MGSYTFRLHPRGNMPPVTEELDANSDADAEDLAKVTLLCTSGYSRAEVYLGSRLIAECRRDSVSS